MKSFLATFVVSIVLCYAVLFFGGALIFNNLLGTLVFVALIISILITAFMHQATEIENLEKRIKALESGEISEETEDRASGEKSEETNEHE